MVRLKDFYFDRELPPSEILNPFCAQNVKKCDVDFTFLGRKKQSSSTFYNYEFSVFSLYELLRNYSFFSRQKCIPLCSADLTIKTYGRKHYVMKVIFSS